MYIFIYYKVYSGKLTIMIAVKLHIQNLIAAHVHWSTKKGHIFKTMDPKLQLFLGIIWNILLLKIVRLNSICLLIIPYLVSIINHEVRSEELLSDFSFFSTLCININTN